MSKSGENIKSLLRSHKIFPLQKYGQNFLADAQTLDLIVESSDIKKTDTVLEIGAGIGNLTERLCKVAGRVVALEVDRQFEPMLAQVTASSGNLQVIFGDALRLPFEEIQEAGRIRSDGGYIAVGNVPYYITSALIKRLLHFPVLPHRVVILLQREVARRIVAKAGDLSRLSLSVQFYGRPEIVLSVPRKLFYPVPDVDSALVVIDDIKRWDYPQPERLVWQLIAFGFSSRRKKLINNVQAGLHVDREFALRLLALADIGADVRAQDLLPEEWISLARARAQMQ